VFLALLVVLLRRNLIIPLFSLDLLDILLDLAHQPCLILSVERGVLSGGHLVLRGRLLKQRLLLLHHSQPLVLLKSHILQVHLRVRGQTLEEVQVTIAPTEVVDIMRDLLVLFLLSPFQEGP